MCGLREPAAGGDDLACLDPQPGLSEADYRACRWIEGTPTPLLLALLCSDSAGQLMVRQASQDRLGLPANLAPARGSMSASPPAPLIWGARLCRLVPEGMVWDARMLRAG
jgi:hypothetical protein